MFTLRCIINDSDDNEDAKRDEDHEEYNDDDDGGDYGADEANGVLST